MAESKLSLGVSICLDCVSIKSLNLDTFKKLVLRIKKIQHFQKFDLDNREVSIVIGRHEIFGQSGQFVSILIER